MKLADMAAWRGLLTGDDPYNRKKESLAGQLRARHIDELVALLEHGTDPEKESALSMFVTLRLALTSDSRFSDRTRATLRQIVLRHVQLPARPRHAVHLRHPSLPRPAGSRSGARRPADQ